MKTTIAPAGESAGRDGVGEIVRTKLLWLSHHAGIWLAVGSLVLLGGCGGGSSANVITVSVSPSTTVIVSTTQTLTATEGGVTTMKVTWTCNFTTTSGTPPKTSAQSSCDSANGAVGKITNPQDTTVVYNAPATVPDPTKFPELQIIITATATADTKKTGSATLILDSGIAIAFTPFTATVPTKEQEQFRITVLTNDTQGKGVTWLITQTSPNSTTPATPIPMLPTCSPDCGMIDKMTGLYTAPATVPTSTKVTSTPAVVTVYAIANADNTRIAQGTITIVAGGPITFNSISPNFAPQGALFWDIYLDAPNISSSSVITVTDPNGGKKMINSVNNSQQVKILFPIPNTTVTAPVSTGARLRLSVNSTPPDLVLAGTYNITVTDAAETVSTPNLPANPAAYQFTVLPVRPTSVASVPDNFNLGSLATGGPGGQSEVQVDGGYFGPGGQFANLLLAGNQVPAVASRSDARHITVNFTDSKLAGLSPGLYPLSLGRTALPLPAVNNSSVTNLALFPDFSGSNNKQALVTPPVPAGNNPGAIDIDTKLGVVVVAETSSNAVQFFRIASTASQGIIQDSLIPIDGVSGQDCAASCPVTAAGGTPMNLPTGLSVNSANHTVAVVNYGSQVVDKSGKQTITGQTVMAFPIPVPGAAAQNPAITPFAIDISNILQGSVVPAPMPYAIGVDPDTNLALVAYSSTSTSAPANLGFVFNMNPNTVDAKGNPSNPLGCPTTTILPPPPPPTGAASAVGQCVFSQVTLNTGVYPQVAMAPHGHLAIVTPGGSGVVRGVDLTQHSSQVSIAGIMVGAGVVTVATTTDSGLIPGNAGSVLIAGVPLPGSPGNSTAINFNGVYSVAVNSARSFSYSVTNTSSSGTLGAGGTVFFNSPNLNFPGSSTTQGIAINPITRTAALADANSTGHNGPQINLLGGLDQSISSITFFAGCTAFTNPCSNAPEFLGTTNLAWQPYTNSIVSYNPLQKQVSVSDPEAQARFAIIPNPLLDPAPQTLGPSGISITVANDSTNTLTLWGGIAVDPATNYAFVAESGSSGMAATPGQIELINLAPSLPTVIRPVNITEIVVPAPTPGLGFVGGVPKATVQQATLISKTDLTGVQIFGSGFGSSSGPKPQVLLDGTAISGNVQVVNDRQLLVSIPAAFLAVPHKYALQVVSNGVTSNAADFLVLAAIDMTTVCATPQPAGVAIADQIANGPFSPVAVVTNSGCHNIAIIDINPASPNFATVINNNSTVGTNPLGIAVSQRFGLAVVANSGDGTASVIDLTDPHLMPKVPAIQTGSNAQPMGVAVNETTGAAVIANFGSNTVSELDLSQLFGSKPATTLTALTVSGIQQPIAVAIDPDRGPSNQGIAVVTALQLISGGSPVGALAVVDIGQATPALSTTSASGSTSATPTGIVFDPTAATLTTNQGVFYANSSGGNFISVFNPDGGGGGFVSVGINPTALAFNPQTGALLTTNLGSQTASIVDMLSRPFKTRQTLGLPGSAQFGVAIDQFTNLAVIVDQANNRVLLFPMPN